MTRWTSLAILICALIIGIILTGIFKSKKTANPEDLSQAVIPVQNIADWYEFTAPDSTFKVLMPGLPHHATESNTEFKTNEMRQHELYVSSKDDGTLFSVLLITFPQKKKEELNSDFLVDFMTAMLKSNQQNKIQFMKPVTFNNTKAVDFSVENQEAVIDGKAFIKDNTLYVLSRTSNLDNRNKKEYDFFVNSFQLGTPKPVLGQQPNKVSK